jgi:hypothetical protein
MKIIILAFLASIAVASAANRYVATNGNNSGAGTIGDPWLTVQRGMTGALTGDVLLLGPGVYPEFVNTVRQGVTIDGQNGATIKRLYLSAGHSNTVVQNLRISGETNYYSRLLYIDHRTHHSVISNVDVDLAGAAKVTGVYWRPGSVIPFSEDTGSDITFVSNIVQNSTGYILMSIQGNRNLIYGNFLRNAPQGDFFNIWGRSNIIRGNICSNLPYAEGLGNHPDFIQTFGNNGVGSTGHIIEQNYIIGIEGGQLSQLSAALMPEIGDWIFRNNVFYRIQLQASCTIRNIWYLNNLFIFCNFAGGHAITFGQRAYAEGGTPSGAGGVDSAHGAKVLNNIFLNCGDGNFSRGWYAFSSLTPTNSITNIMANYNYVAKINYTPVKVDTLQRDVGDPGGWSTFAWWEDNGINGDGTPVFEDYFTADLRLTTNSPVINAGTNLSAYFTNDFFGNPRTGWNIGPFEVGASFGGSNAPSDRPPVRVSNLRVGTINIIEP